MAAPADFDRATAAVRDVVARHPSLRLLILFGSRGRQDARIASDWDFGFRAAPGFDPMALRADLVGQLGTNHLDLADLDRAGGLLRYRAARDGFVLYEREKGSFARFWTDAVRFWCDAQPVLEGGYEDLLARLPR